MKPLLVLVGLFLASLIVTTIGFGKTDIGLSLKMAMSGMLLFTAIGHFAFTKGMAAMLPDVVPYKSLIIYLTGLVEIAAAIILLIPSLSIATAWFLIAFFLILLPANISAAIRHIDYQRGTEDGPGLRYLWFRIPLQLLFIFWTAAIIYNFWQ